MVLSIYVMIKKMSIEMKLLLVQLNGIDIKKTENTEKVKKNDDVKKKEGEHRKKQDHPYIHVK